MDLYYIYKHTDPIKNIVMYVGLGQDERAWVSRNRSKEHKAWLHTLYADGYTLQDIVDVCAKNMNKKDAMSLEKELVIEHTPVFNKLLNPEHWHKSRKNNEQTCLFMKALRDMNYSLTNIAYLSGSPSPNTNAMSIKRMIEYV